MSIILQGINLPKTGERVYAEIRPSGEVEYIAVTYDKDCTRSAKVEKTNAVQIPKDHGRLIDADRFLRNYVSPEELPDDPYYDGAEDVLEDLRYTHTILEAEGGKDESERND